MTSIPEPPTPQEGPSPQTPPSPPPGGPSEQAAPRGTRPHPECPHVSAPPGPLAPESTAPQGLSLITRHPAHRSRPQSISSPPPDTPVSHSHTFLPHWLSQVDPEARRAGRLRGPHGGGRSSWARGQSKGLPRLWPLQRPLPTYQPKASYLHGGRRRERRGQRPVWEGHIRAVGQLLLPVRRPQNTEEVRSEQGPVCTSSLSSISSWA